MKTCLVSTLASLALVPFTVQAQTAPETKVRFRTVLGNIDVVLLPEVAPQTVANFLNYVNRGAYDNSIIHRLVPGFIFQGGGQRVQGDRLVNIPADPPVVNEPRISNTRGTIAMAKLGDQPNSATNEWFFNLADSNASNLDNQNGGFTVFGQVADTPSLAVMDRIAAQRLYPIIAGETPLINYSGGTPLVSNLVVVHSVSVLASSEPPAIRAGGIITPSAYSGVAEAAPGSYIEIYGSNLSGTTRPWSESDFSDGAAPTTLDDVSVTVDGQPAFVSYVSPGQVNVQVPANVAVGQAVPVAVSHNGVASTPVNVALQARVPRLLAPASFNINGRHYAAAFHHPSFAVVSNGDIPNAAAAPAAPGETIIFYGVGFGPLEDGTPVAGRVAEGQTSVAADVQFRIGSTQAQVTYAGLAPTFVGLYQFNVVVPASAPNGDLPLEVIVDGQPIPQTLILPVRAAN